MHDFGARLGVLDLGHVDVLGPDTGRLERGARRDDRRSLGPLRRQRRAEHLESSVVARPQCRRLQEDRRVGVPAGHIGIGQYQRHRALAGRAEHVLGQRVADHVGRGDVLGGHRRAPPGVRVLRSVAIGLGRDQREDAGIEVVLVQVPLDLDGEELGGHHHPDLAVPVAQAIVGRAGVERAGRMLVETDGHADVVRA